MQLQITRACRIGQNSNWKGALLAVQRDSQGALQLDMLYSSTAGNLDKYAAIEQVAGHTDLGDALVPRQVSPTASGIQKPFAFILIVLITAFVRSGINMMTFGAQPSMPNTLQHSSRPFT